jgi:hypothetical protein
MIFAFAKRLWDWLRPPGHPLIGWLAVADFIPSRPYMERMILGSVLFEVPSWSEPFWAITIQTEFGEYLHACLDHQCFPPSIGEKVSLVARARGIASSRREVSAILRPPTPLRKR